MPHNCFRHFPLHNNEHICMTNASAVASPLSNASSTIEILSIRFIEVQDIYSLVPT